MFIKYQHVERFGTDEVLNIEYGTCYVFPKIDGTNASVWFDGIIGAGSRKRELSLESDNAGFYEYVFQSHNLKLFFEKYPDLRLYGEWLIPHSLKTYKDTAWNRFYVFDVTTIEDDEFKYLTYDEYQPLLEEFGLDYIPPIKIVKNGIYETFIKLLEQNDFLIEDGKGTGEGIVIKNYDFVNKFGKVTWAKIVTSDFKEKHSKTLGAPTMEGELMPEDRALEFCTEILVNKVYESIRVANGGWQSKYIPQLLGRVWYDFINEEIWNILKKLGNPTINFKTLQYKVNQKIKELLPEVF